MSGISTPVPTSVPIIPPNIIQTAPGGFVVDGFIISLTTFILGSIFMLMLLWYIFTIVFGQPMTVARESVTKGSIIQHFNTSKSALMKIATIAGGAFRYQNIRDGTVAATSNSVNSISGRNIVLTFAQLGVTIPIPVLGAISILVHNGINSITDLKNSQRYTEIYTEKKLDPETNIEEEVEVERKEKYKNDIIVTGYNFEDFNKLLKQSEEERLIPLVIEAVPDFVERNISADYTEKKIKIRQQLNASGQPDNEHLKIMTIAVAVIIVFLVGMVIK